MRNTVARSQRPQLSRSQKFAIDCFPFIFSIEELKVLENKGNKMKALAEGSRKPASSEEEMFVKVVKGLADPLTAMDTAWLKYQQRRRIEASLLQTEELYQEYLRIRKS